MLFIQPHELATAPPDPVPDDPDTGDNRTTKTTDDRGRHEPLEID